MLKGSLGAGLFQWDGERHRGLELQLGGLGSALEQGSLEKLLS